MGLLHKFGRLFREAHGIVFHDNYKDAQAYEALVRTFWGRGLLGRHIADLFEVNVPVHDAHPYILDLGAGTGIISRELYKRGYKVCAGDINETVLEHIRLQNQHIERVICDFNKPLPFAANSFDGVTSVWANRYIKKDGLYVMLDEVKRVLKPGGVFLWPIFPADTVMWKMKNGVGQITSAKTLAGIMRENGFASAEQLDDLFYRNMFSMKLPPHTVPVYIIARK